MTPGTTGPEDLVLNDISRRARVMIVEDNAIIAEAAAGNLGDMGCEIAGIYATAEEALRGIEARKPDLVLMDVGLPGEIDGCEAALIIRRRWGLPVIICTGDGLSAREKGFTYLVKPTSGRALRAAVREVLGAQGPLAPIPAPAEQGRTDAREC